MPSYSMKKSTDKIELVEEKQKDDQVKPISFHSISDKIRILLIIFTLLTILSGSIAAFVSYFGYCEKEHDQINCQCQIRDNLYELLQPYLNSSDILHKAISSNDTEALKSFINLGSDINSRNDKLETPLIQAAKIEDKKISLEMVKFLIKSGADVKLKDEKGQNFLHKMVSDGTSLTPSEFQEVTNFIIDEGYPELFNEVDNFGGTTPIMLAIKNLEVNQMTIDLLNENEVNFNLSDKHGNSIFYYALEGRRSTKFMKNLVKLGVDWKHLNNYNHSLVHLAANVCYLDGLKFFLSLGLDINAQGSYGDTPLHQVTFFGNVNVLETVKFLIENGANAKVKDEGGSSPLDYVMMRGEEDLPEYEKIVKLLQN